MVTATSIVLNKWTTLRTHEKHFVENSFQQKSSQDRAVLKIFHLVNLRFETLFLFRVSEVATLTFSFVIAGAYYVDFEILMY